MANTNKNAIHYQILNVLLSIIIIFSLVTLVINLINNRPLEVFSISIFSFLSSSFLLYLSIIKRREVLAKYIFMISYGFFYVPLAWLTSPGATSAMPLYALITIVLMTIFSENKKDLFFPGIVIVETLVLFQVEIRFPYILVPFPSDRVRIYDVSLNFFIISVTLVVIIFLINQMYIRKNREVYQLSITDELTGLYNRHYFMNVLKGEINRCNRSGDVFSLIMLDLNDFKSINDAYGHLTGDQVLIKLAEILVKNSRSYDVCGRYGGDEFIIILPNTSVEEAIYYIERVKKEFNSYAEQYKRAKVSIAIGVTSGENKTIREVINIADKRLYRNKKSV